MGGLLEALLSADFPGSPGGTRENGWVGIPEGVSGWVGIAQGVSGYPTPTPLKDFAPTPVYGL